MKKCFVRVGSVSYCFLFLTSADYKSLEEQNAAIEKPSKLELMSLSQRKTAECDAMVDAKSKSYG
ncbi:MAG: hypothetical protein IPL95_12305 [Saprospiraceae bacterium]|nr:hypothetical protein [Saprospiraceae bacterium]